MLPSPLNNRSRCHAAELHFEETLAGDGHRRLTPKMVSCHCLQLIQLAKSNLLFNNNTVTAYCSVCDSFVHNTLRGILFSPDLRVMRGFKTA